MLKNASACQYLKSSSPQQKAVPSSSSLHAPQNELPFNYFTNLSLHRHTELSGKQKLSSLYSSLGWAMRPSVYLLLSGLPLVVYFHSYSISLTCLSLTFATLYCIYCYVIQLQRQRVACALGVISDPEILELVAKSMPGWVLSPEKNRVDWVNHLLQAAWPMIGTFAENKILIKAQEIFQKEKPDLLTSMELTNVVSGTIPPKILSIQILNSLSTTAACSPPHKPTQIQLEVEFVWLSDGYVVIEIGFLGQVFSIEVCKLILSGTVRIAIDPNEEPIPGKPIKLVKATFIKNPKVDVTVSFGDLLPNSSINAKVIGLGPIISQVLPFLPPLLFLLLFRFLLFLLHAFDTSLSSLDSQPSHQKKISLSKLDARGSWFR
jgi:hypothetical protein